MLRTRAGYAGGTTPAPTYQSIGDHTEVISVDFDPTLTSFEEILETFWQSHHSLTNRPGTQYRNVLFYRSEAQLQMAEDSFAHEASRRGVNPIKINTHLEALKDFTYAEKYHQNYALTPFRGLRTFLETTYPDEKSFADSVVASRLNAYLGTGLKRDWEQFREELPQFGLPDPVEKEIAPRISR